MTTPCPCTHCAIERKQKEPPISLGDPIEFTTVRGTAMNGTVTGRDWAFSRILSYSVDGADGKRYHVNAADFQAGHPY